MSQTTDLLRALKKCLRAKGLTYRDVAGELGISEASVKRIFSEQTFSVARLEDVCRILDMSIYDLARLTRLGSDEDVTVLTIAQERGLAEESALLTYFYLLLIGRTPRKIETEFGLSKKRTERMLVRLSRLKLIELYPKQRIRLLTDRRIEWRPDGPIRKLYERQVKEEFMRTNFTGRDEVLRFDTGELSDASIKVLERKIERLSKEFDELVDLELSLPAEKKRGFGLMIGFRPWTYWRILVPNREALRPGTKRQRTGRATEI